MVEIQYEVGRATRIKVNLSDDVSDYAKSFLAIYNNVKNDRDLLKVYNDYGNGVYVVCENHVKDAAVSFLRQFGTIAIIEEVEVVKPSCFDYKYKDNLDTEFLAIEEI